MSIKCRYYNRVLCNRSVLEAVLQSARWPQKWYGLGHYCLPQLGRLARNAFTSSGFLIKSDGCLERNPARDRPGEKVRRSPAAAVLSAILYAELPQLSAWQQLFSWGSAAQPGLMLSVPSGMSGLMTRLSERLELIPAPSSRPCPSAS